MGIELGQWADLRHVGRPPSTLAERARLALALYPAQLLFVHRDAEARPLETRLQEIREAVADVAGCYVAVVPVRTTEAWLLHDEQAIRRASGNPSGTVPLHLPSASAIERDPNPKSTLEEALLVASELTGRRRNRRKAEFPQMRARTAELIADFSPLRALPAFRAFLEAIDWALVELGHLRAMP